MGTCTVYPPLNITTKMVFILQLQEITVTETKSMCWQVLSNKYIYNWPCVLEYIMVCHSCCHHREFTSWCTHEERCCYRGFEMTSQLLPLILSERTPHRISKRDMRLTLRLNQVSMIFLCEYDLTWTRTEPQVRLGPGPSQVSSQVSSQDCVGIWPQGISSHDIDLIKPR